jgi:tripartite ATP-independent transporter DctM subunit
MDVISTYLPILVLLLLIALGTPIGISLGLAGALGILLNGGGPLLANALANMPYSATASYTLTLIPLFIFMGMCFSHSGMLAGIFDVANRLVGRLPGGLGVATVGASTFFGGITGSSVADAATLGRLSISEMSKRGYERHYAAAIVASSATIAILIPPSIVLVLYGIIAQVSVGRLLLAGIVPGLVTALAYALYIMWRGRDSSPRPRRKQSRRGWTAQRHAATVPDEFVADRVGGEVAVSDRFTQVFGVLAGLMVFSALVGGLYFGVFTATEAGAVAAFLAFAMATAYLLSRRRRQLGPAIGASFRETGSLTAMIFLLVVGATLFTHYLVIAGIPTDVSAWIVSLPVAPSVVIVLFLVALIPMGMLIDGLSMLLIVTPIMYPIVAELGYDGVWFGILLVKLIEIGLLTPPVGLNVFVVAGLFPSLKAEGVFRAVVPFIVIELVLCSLFFLFPEVVLFLPDLASPKL